MSDKPHNPFVAPPSGTGQDASQHRPADGGEGEGVEKDTASNGGSTPHIDGPVARFTPLVFSGTARALFGLQFVNILLILVTVGIWTPWARVRIRRFFYNNTRILGEGLDYLATGLDLFKGWIVVVGLLMLFYALPFLGIPFLQEGASLVLLAIYPWAINRSLRFNARNLAWRDVRFDFTGTYFGSAWYLFLLPFIGVLSLGILLPVASKGMREYVARNYSFGAARFGGKGQLASYYGVGLKCLLLSLVLIGVGAVVVGLAIYGNLGTATPMQDDLASVLADGFGVGMGYLVPIMLVLIFTLVGGYYRALTRNIMVNALQLQGGIKFRSHISGFGLGWIIVSNLILSVVTLGLLLPWAKVRQYRYLSQNTEIRPAADVQGYLDRQTRAGNSIGDAVGEAGGLEINF